MMPENIRIDNFLIDDLSLPEENPPEILPVYNTPGGWGKPYPYRGTKHLTLCGVRTASGKPVPVSCAEKLYPKLKVNYE